ncbi:SAV_915 family protein [Actinomyces gerencseriae]|uniref:SAV_915 family protein n=1 Tax=Actinomyces gerencseriae TaxID=52769 RepID=UPI0028F00568|nr:SAV_915 family protein [Actinomyces gerencseriae]
MPSIPEGMILPPPRRSGPGPGRADPRHGPPGSDPGRAADSGRSSPGRPAESGRPPIPPALYLPSTGASNTRGAEIELRQMRDGRVALLAYTALDRLARCLGPNQPWVLYLTENLDQLEAVQSYDVIYLDTPVPRNLWHQTKDDEDGAVR